MISEGRTAHLALIIIYTTIGITMSHICIALLKVILVDLPNDLLEFLNRFYHFQFFHYLFAIIWMHIELIPHSQLTNDSQVKCCIQILAHTQIYYYLSYATWASQIWFHINYNNIPLVMSFKYTLENSSQHFRILYVHICFDQISKFHCC